ncbi:MAG: hypothetical protein ACPGXZ_05170, partial [Saprospiraceae bacterium]
QVELLIYFCQKLNEFKPSFKRNTILSNLYYRQINIIKKTVLKLHEDLQFDYGEELNELLNS